MKHDEEMLIDDLIRVVQVIGHDTGLRSWIFDLEKLPSVDRRNELLAMALRAEGDGREFKLLADPRVFDAVLTALREL